MDRNSCGTLDNISSSQSSVSTVTSTESDILTTTIIEPTSNSFSFKDVLRRITHSKDTCIQFLQQNGTFKTEMLCPGPNIKGNRSSSCGRFMAIKKVNDRKDLRTWRCRRTHTINDGDKKYTVKDVKVSIRHDSWLLNVNLQLEIVIELIYLWTHNYTNARIQHELQLSKKTVIEWTYFFREVCLAHVMEISEPIGGNGVEVEIDESKFGKRKYHRGKRVEGKWVFGGREKYDKSKIFMVPVEKRNAKTLIPIIQKWIKPGSIIHSDCWKAYSKLEKLGYTHVTVNHSKEFVNEESAACTNAIESDWRHAKAFIPNYGIHRGLHAGYLAEFLWFRRNHDKDTFIELIKTTNECFNKGYLNCIIV